MVDQSIAAWFTLKDFVASLHQTFWEEPDEMASQTWETPDALAPGSPTAPVIVANGRTDSGLFEYGGSTGGLFGKLMLSVGGAKSTVTP